MKTKIIIANVALALTLGVLYTGCDKTKDDVVDTDTSSANDNSTSENSFSGIFKSVSNVSDTTTNLRTTTGCATITIDTTVGSTHPFPKTCTIDYGTGCTTTGRSGKIIAIFTGHFRSPNTIVTITTSNYCDGLNKIVAGTHTIINNGLNTAGHKTYSINIANAVLTNTASGGVISWNCTRTLEWIAGDLTPLDPSDDVYSISGQTTGTSAKGVTFTAAITTPLRVATSCSWIESGVVTLTPQGKKPRVVDFGSTTTNTCDNKATVTISGKTYDVTM